MRLDSLALEGLTAADEAFEGSRFSTVREAVFANPYQKVWSGPGRFPRFVNPLSGVIRGSIIPFLKWTFFNASQRTLRTHNDLRWGPDGKGFQRLVHPNGMIMTGLWEITEDTPYSGYFRKGSRGLLVVRFSVCCNETRGGYMRSLAMVGKVYPTTDAEDPRALPTANFFSQQDFGGEITSRINEVVMTTAPNTHTFRRGFGVPIIVITAFAFLLSNKQPTIRQLYEIAELGKPPNEPTRAPEYMQLSVSPEQPAVPQDNLDFRDEVMAQLYDPGDPQPKRTLTFDISTSDEGRDGGNPINQLRFIENWRKIGRMTFREAVASENGDRVIHFHHPVWRDDRNDPKTATIRKWWW